MRRSILGLGLTSLISGLWATNVYMNQQTMLMEEYLRRQPELKEETAREAYKYANKELEKFHATLKYILPFMIVGGGFLTAFGTRKDREEK